MAEPALPIDPCGHIERSSMGLRQWIVIVLMIALNALDGFDVSSSAFAAPGLSKEWGVPRNCGYWSIMTGAWCSCSTRA